MLYEYLIEMDKPIPMMKWYKNGQARGYTLQSMNLKSPLLNPTNHPTDAQSLQHAKPQVVSVTVPLSGISDVNPVTGVNGNTTGISLGISQNSFDTEMQTIQQFNPIPAPGAMETVQVRTMRPLSNTSQANQDTRVISRLGTVTVSVS